MTATERRYELDRMEDEVEALWAAGHDVEARRLLARWGRQMRQAGG